MEEHIGRQAGLLDVGSARALLSSGGQRVRDARERLGDASAAAPCPLPAGAPSWGGSTPPAADGWLGLAARRTLAHSCGALNLFTLTGSLVGGHLARKEAEELNLR
jgi:hypothetical protein